MKPLPLAPTAELDERRPLATPAAQLARLREAAPEADFGAALAEVGLSPLRARGVDTLQVNVGKLCNQTCRHCHVDAGPHRTDEMMSREVAEACIEAASRLGVSTLDITGGAPELSPQFRYLVEAAHGLGLHIIDRCNLTVLESSSQRDLADFLARHGVEVVCSLPHYRRLSTDRQRGDGVYEKSIRALRRLNALGYADGESGLQLTLVTNPVGAFLPANQASLEREWKRELLRLHDVRFDRLFTITNMPIARYLEWLDETDNLVPYLARLRNAFNPGAATGVMCRDLISVAWDGRVYDCDFNQMLELGANVDPGQTIADVTSAALGRREIATERHCFGCTAGQGSSCGGATA